MKFINITPLPTGQLDVTLCSEPKTITQSVHDQARKELVTAVNTMRNLQIFLTSNERIAMWGDITEGYCDYCGEFKGDKVCNCTNDD